MQSRKSTSKDRGVQLGQSYHRAQPWWQMAVVSVTFIAAVDSSKKSPSLPSGPLTHGGRGVWKRRVHSTEDRKKNGAITGRSQG